MTHRIWSLIPSDNEGSTRPSTQRTILKGLELSYDSGDLVGTAGGMEKPTSPGQYFHGHEFSTIPRAGADRRA